MLLHFHIYRYTHVYIRLYYFENQYWFLVNRSGNSHSKTTSTYILLVLLTLVSSLGDLYYYYVKRHGNAVHIKPILKYVLVTHFIL